MRRLYFRLIVPDGPLRRFRLAEDFGELHKAQEGAPFARVAGVMLAWCGLSAGCWLLAEGHLLPGVSLEPMMALSDEVGSARLALAVPGAPHGLLTPPGGRTMPGTNPGKATANPAAAMQSNQANVPPAVHLSPKLRQDLPRVSYSVNVLHRGGQLGREEPSASDTALATLSSEPEAFEETPSNGPSLRPEALQSAHNAALRSSARADAERSIDPKDVPASPPKATEPSPSPTPYRNLASNDPFESDFVRVRPSFAARSNVPLPREPSASTTSVSSAQPALAERHDSSRGGSHVLTTGGGCQAAFEASNQVVNVGKSAVGTDATSEDYTAALARLNVAGCHPANRLSIQVCVAVAERRAVGTTVTTSPGNASVATCIARQIAGLRFPASTGADLVRTRIDIE